MTDRLAHEFDRETERQVRVHIQDGSPGGSTYFSRALVKDVRVVLDDAKEHPPGLYVLTVELPDSVAEVYRQQGRRQLQSELRGALNVARA